MPATPPKAVSNTEPASPPAGLRETGKRAVSSVALLQGASELVIVHQGQEYRLRLTRQGKLLLTK
jgi:hemin uptake protein HemP